MEGQNKPAQVIDKIVEGKLNSFYEQVCLLDQPSIRDPKVTIGQLVQAAIAKMGENIAIPRFVRFKLGETQLSPSSARAFGLTRNAVDGRESSRSDVNPELREHARSDIIVRICPCPPTTASC